MENCPIIFLEENFWHPSMFIFLNMGDDFRSVYV